MDDFLEKQNIKLKHTKYNDWYINKIFYDLSDVSKLEIIMNKYSINTYEIKNFNVDDSDLNYLLTLKSDNNHILIESIIDYLIANSKRRNKSCLVYDSIILINTFFENVDAMKSRLFSHTLFVVLKWAINKFPDKKDDIKRAIINNIKTCPDYSNNLWFLDYLMQDKYLLKIMSADEFVMLFCDNISKDCSIEEIHVWLKFYQHFIDFLIKSKYKQIYQIKKNYCDFVLMKIDYISSRESQILLQLVRDYMDELKIYSDNDYYLIDHKLEIVNKDALNNLKLHSIKLPDEYQEKIKDAIKSNYKLYGQLTNSKKIDYLIYNAIPFPKNELAKNVENSKSVFDDIVQQSYLDADGRVINYHELKEEEIFSIKVIQFIDFNVRVFIDVYFTPFINTFMLDDNAKKYIFELLAHNKLVANDRVDNLKDSIERFFSQDFKGSTYDIVLEFEESIRYFLKNQKLNIKKRDKSGDVIGLNNIFNDYENNSYRDKLLEIIDEDNYFTMKWLLTDPYGWDLRDKISHRLNSNNLYMATISIFAVLQILRYYWFFQE